MAGADACCGTIVNKCTSRGQKDGSASVSAQHLLSTAEGSGKLLDAHTVEVALSAGGTERITAKHILLAVGGRAVKAPIEGSVSYPRLVANAAVCMVQPRQHASRCPQSRCACTSPPYVRRLLRSSKISAIFPYARNPPDVCFLIALTAPRDIRSA